MVDFQTGVPGTTNEQLAPLFEAITQCARLVTSSLLGLPALSAYTRTSPASYG
ncbi:hypothetical protein Slala05_84990 [Streptomyces lavendulae subsp. lavendulae]|nr:hypothetical protein Slala05_84990 [Streptomyces lavendulae subsp. lavendulae]